MTADLPAIARTIVLDGLGSITRTGELVFRAETLDGHSYVSHNCLRADMGYRVAENYLRKRMGLPELSKLCCVCGKEIPPSCTYCGKDCRLARKGRTAALQHASELPASEVLARAQREAAKRPERHSGELQPVTSGGNYSAGDVRDLRAARMAADELIRRRGGRIPPKYDGYLRDLR